MYQNDTKTIQNIRTIRFRKIWRGPTIKNQLKQSKKKKQCKTIRNHTMTEDLARADDYNRPDTLQNNTKLKKNTRNHKETKDRPPKTSQPNGNHTKSYEIIR